MDSFINRQKQGSGESQGDSENDMIETVLFEGWTPFDVNSQITLSDDADKYDAIVIFTSLYENDDKYYTHYGRCIIPKSDIQQSIAETPNGKTYSGFVDAPTSESGNSYRMGWVFNMPNKKTLTSKEKRVTGWTNSLCGIHKVTGVKMKGGAEEGSGEETYNGIRVKTLTYTGTGLTSNSLTFPDTPFMIIGFIQDPMEQQYTRGLIPFVFHRSNEQLCLCWTGTNNAGTSYQSYSNIRVHIDGNTMAWTGPDASQALNMANVQYTIYYI